MTEPSPVREQLQKMTALHPSCPTHALTEWLIDGIEAVYRTLQDAYSSEDQNIVDSAWDDAMAKLERLLKGRHGSP